MSCAVYEFPWIPCDKKLPEKHGKYLVTIKTWLGDPRAYVSILWYDTVESEDTVPCWHDYDDEWGNIIFNDVIAWMPLPEPYKTK